LGLVVERNFPGIVDGSGVIPFVLTGLVMAKRERPDGLPEAEVDMTPMIDIVFQLIAFFAVITNFEETQADERVKLPRDTLAKPPEVKVEHQLVLNVGFYRNMEGEKTDEQPWLFNFDAGEAVLPLSAGPQLSKEAALFKNKDIDPADVTVKVRADAEVQTGIVQELIKLCQNAGFETFAMSAMSGPEE
jgi:biopolymer transport protein ExbD